MNDDVKIRDSRKLKNLRLMTKTGRHLHIVNEVSSRKSTVVLLLAIALFIFVSGILIWAFLYVEK